MEFLAGDSLSAAIAEGPLPRERALAIVRQILRGLDHAHGAGVVHRDLKPDNIMLVERDGQRDVVKILDFGIAKVTEPQSGGQALTQAGVIFGTPEYLSPEQALGEAVDARTDIYAAGVILFEMLAGRRPFESEDKVKIISMHLAHAPPRIRDVNPAVRRPDRDRAGRPAGDGEVARQPVRDRRRLPAGARRRRGAGGAGAGRRGDGDSAGDAICRRPAAGARRPSRWRCWWPRSGRSPSSNTASRATGRRR